MEQIFLAYSYPSETVTAIMMIYTNMKGIVRLLDGDNDFFDIVVEVLQGDALAPYFFIFFLKYRLRMSIDE